MGNSGELRPVPGITSCFSMKNLLSQVGLLEGRHIPRSRLALLTASETILASARERSFRQRIAGPGGGNLQPQAGHGGPHPDCGQKLLILEVLDGIVKVAAKN